MTGFNFIDCAGKGYHFLWDARETILRISILPFVIKVISFIAVTTLGLSDAFLRQGILFIPSHFLEGWLAACLIRLAIFQEPWPTVLSPDKAQNSHYMLRRTTTILSATIVYVLIQMILSVFFGLLFDQMQDTAEVEALSDAGMSAIVASFIIFIAMVLAFRFLWLYIPFAMGFKIKSYLHSVQGLTGLFYLIGIVLLCSIPIEFVFMMIMDPLSVDISDFSEFAENTSFLEQLLVFILQSIREIILVIVISVALAFAVQSLQDNSSHQKKNKY